MSWDTVSLVDYITDDPYAAPDGWRMRNDTILESPDGSVWLIECSQLDSGPGSFAVAIADDVDDPLTRTELVAELRIADAESIGLAIGLAVLTAATLSSHHADSEGS